jgi:hypothetical protein
LTGKAPFYFVKGNVVILLKVKAGKRPTKKGHGFPNPILWSILEDGWAQSPEERPEMITILDRLAQAQAQA